jgi:DNA-binding IclR family transcriptional regulator
MWAQQQGGATEREIAAATGLSKSHVHRLLVREAERRQLLEEVPADAGAE